MSNIGWSINDDYYYENMGRSESTDRYYGCSQALAYYELALDEAKDPVLKALACRMAGECDMNWRYYSTPNSSGEWTNPYKAGLEGEAATVYGTIEDCMGYADFIRRYR